MCPIPSQDILTWGVGVEIYGRRLPQMSDGCEDGPSDVLDLKGVGGVVVQVINQSC